MAVAWGGYWVGVPTPSREYHKQLRHEGKAIIMLCMGSPMLYGQTNIVHAEPCCMGVLPCPLLCATSTLCRANSTLRRATSTLCRATSTLRRATSALQTHYKEMECFMSIYEDIFYQ